MKYVKVIFKSSADNYTTCVSPKLSDKEIEDYFVGTTFNLGVTKDKLRECTAVEITYPHISKAIEKIKKSIEALNERLDKENRREVEVFNNLGFGAGMRRNKISVSSTKSDAIRERIARQETKLETLKISRR